jgi:hypothetical protein
VRKKVLNVLVVFLIFLAPNLLAHQASLSLNEWKCPSVVNAPLCQTKTEWGLEKWSNTPTLSHPNQTPFSFGVKVTEVGIRKILSVTGTIVMVNSGDLSAPISSMVLNLQIHDFGGFPHPLGEMCYTTVQSAIAVASDLCKSSNVAKICSSDVMGSPNSKLTLYDYLTHNELLLKDLPPVPHTASLVCDSAVKLNFKGEFDITGDTIFGTINQVRFEILVTFGGAGKRSCSDASCTQDVNCNGIIDPDDTLTALVNESEENNIRTIPFRAEFHMPDCDTVCSTVILSDEGAQANPEGCLTLTSDEVYDTLTATGIPGTSYDYQITGMATCGERRCTTTVENTATLQGDSCDVIIDQPTAQASFDVKCSTSVSGVNEESQNPDIKKFTLFGNSPNPFNPETEISYYLPKDGEVKIIIYNTLGQKIRTLVDEFQRAGYRSARWDGKDQLGNPVASGVYFYRVQANRELQVRKMTLVK